MIDLTKSKKAMLHDHEVLARIATAIDLLDTNECNEDTLGMSVFIVLRALQYSDVDAMSAGIMSSKSIGDAFPTLYWKEPTLTNKLMAFSSVLEAAKMLIEEGKLSDNIRHQAAKILAQADENKPSAPDSK